MDVMKYFGSKVCILIFVFAVFSTDTEAQGLEGIAYTGWGVRAGVSSDPDQGYAGLHFNLGEFAKDVRFRPSLELGMGDDQTIIQMMGEVHYVFSKVQVWKPYIGGGLGLTYIDYDDHHYRRDDDTEMTFTPIGGIETSINEKTNLFFELKLGLAGDHPDVKFGVGISWK
ncbi:MAG: hypothetical protein JW932_09255 [Deltaproteobacteria bacterium]|nr:hypothetical protein [Deltaproteobacteria bacterium]